MTRRRTTDIIGAAVATAVLLVSAACTSAGDPSTMDASPSPAVSPTPETTKPASPAPPSPTPDTATLVLDSLSDPSLTARIRYHGTERVPSSMWVGEPSGSWEPVGEASDLVIEYDGEAYLEGGDYVLRQQGPGPTLVWGELRIGPTLWHRDFQARGWARSLAAESLQERRLFELLATLPSLSPAGETTIAGERLLRFRAPPETALSLVTIFQQTTAMKAPDQGSLELLARPDGTPVSVTVMLLSDDLDYSEVMPPGLAAPPRTYEFTFEFEDVGQPVALPDPAEPTAAYDSPRFGISFVGPDGMVVDRTDDGYDEFQVLSEGQDPWSAIRVRRWKFEGDEAKDQEAFLAGITEWEIDDLEKNWGATRVSLEAIEIDGLPAMLFAVSSKAGADPAYFHLEAYAVSGPTVFMLSWHTEPTGVELADRFRFEQLLGTVSLTD